jgi:hypothetical protein
MRNKQIRSLKTIIDVIMNTKGSLFQQEVLGIVRFKLSQCENLDYDSELWRRNHEDCRAILDFAKIGFHITTVKLLKNPAYIKLPQHVFDELARLVKINLEAKGDFSYKDFMFEPDIRDMDFSKLS